MAFHRYTVPGYAGGLRAGDDYINHGDGAGTPAPAAGVLAAGVNVGSYFFGDGEQITVAAINRGMRALAENCDFLDDELVALDATVSGYTAAIAAVEASALALDARLDTVETDLANVVDTVNNVLDAIRTVTADATLHSPTRDATFIIDPPDDTTINIQLPNPAACDGWKVMILNGNGLLGTDQDSDGTNGKAVLVRFGAETINAYAGDYDLDIPFGGWWLVSDGTNWHIRAMTV